MHIVPFAEFRLSSSSSCLLYNPEWTRKTIAGQFVCKSLLLSAWSYPFNVLDPSVWRCFSGNVNGLSFSSGSLVRISPSNIREKGVAPVVTCGVVLSAVNHEISSEGQLYFSWCATCKHSSNERSGVQPHRHLVAQRNFLRWLIILQTEKRL